MKHLLLIAFLLIAPVAGAEERCRIAELDSMAHGDVCACEDGILRCWDKDQSADEYQKCLNLKSNCNSLNGYPTVVCYREFVDCTESIKDQPAEEATAGGIKLPAGATIKGMCVNGECPEEIIVSEAKPNCPEINCNFDNPSGKMCSLDLATGCAVYVEQSDAEKWREKCEYWTNFANGSKPSEYTIRAYTYFCTRYNSAILEEMRNK